MAGPRHTSVRALRQLAQQTRQQPARKLHLLPHHPPRPNAPKAIAPAQQTFTTSQRRQSPHDSHTIDDVYLPMTALAVDPNATFRIAVPLLPTNYSPPREGANAVEPESGFLASTGAKARADDEAPASTIHTIAGNGTHWGVPSAMSDADHHHGEVDFAEVAKGLARVVGTVEQQVARESGVARQLWHDVMEDIFGPPRKPAS